ncbi:MAG TPA: Nif3-like dinuclear metal center hexameric protein [Planctomycetaceae bacterium]|nr:Nif3-like dinuclear metal center hexameric protein [Planctomycetaceae bacterium]
MTSCDLILQYLQTFAPLELAEDWDNVGLLLGNCEQDISSVMTCLTLTPDVATEAIEKNVDLIVTHHPILFRAVQRITTETSEGAMLLDLARNDIAVYSPHTAFDSAARGINQQWCERLKLQNCLPLQSSADLELAGTGLGSGRMGTLTHPMLLQDLILQIKSLLSIESVQFVGQLDAEISKAGIACGAAAEYMKQAQAQGCQVLVTGEARFHACLEARQRGIALVLVGHFHSERFACEKLAEILQNEFPQIHCFASQIESDPINLL